MKHDASRAASTAEEGRGGDNIGVDGADGIATAAAAAATAAEKKANSNLGVGVDMADQADLVLAMQGVLGRADEGTKPGEFCFLVFCCCCCCSQSEMRVFSFARRQKLL